MNPQDIVTIISSVGFPIVAACAMFYLYDNTIKNIINTLNVMNQTLEELSDIIKKVNNDGNSK